MQKKHFPLNPPNNLTIIFEKKQIMIVSHVSMIHNNGNKTVLIRKRKTRSFLSVGVSEMHSKNLRFV